MGMKPNQRIALTKELIHRALIELVKKQEIHKISIRELCNLAGINRTTFYNHYGSQYDVLSEIRDDYISDIASAIESADPSSRESVLRRVTLVLEYVANNLDISKLLIQNNIDETFVQRLFSLPKIEDLLSESLSNLADPEDEKAVVSFVVYGSYKLIQDWIAQGERSEPETMARRILTLAGAVCNTI